MAQRTNRRTSVVDTQSAAGGVREGGGLFGFRNWRVSTKLIAVLLLPALAAVAAGALRVTDRVADAERAASNARLSAAESAALDLVSAIGDEQFVAVSIGAGAPAVTEELGTLARLAQNTNAASRRLVAAAEQTGEREAVAQVLPALEVTLSTLDGVRETLQDPEATPPQAVVVARRYDDVARAATVVAQAIASEVVFDDIQQQQALASAALSDVLRRDALEDAFVLAVTAQGPGAVVAEEFDAVAESRWEARNAFQGLSSQEDRAAVVDARTSEAGVTRARIFPRLLGAVRLGATPELTAREWAQIALAAREPMQELRADISGAQVSRADSETEGARLSALTETVVILALLLLGLALTIFAARAIIRPLRVLRDDANEIARERLPGAIDEIRREGSDESVHVEPVAVHTREETGQVARAFDAVHSQAVRLAGEQERLRQNVNEVFVNLSRRSQGLVERQLRLIDRLENDEQNPDQLAQLFRLDHLASRMRRYNDNLMVLAGSAGHARSSQAMSAVDVLRAAVSETEQYQRIVVEQAPALTVSASASSDLVHLLAELLENATSFSPPDTDVTVEVTGTREHGLVVEVIDKGLGISPADMVALNDKLANPPVVDPAVPRQMGLFVVSQLAKRHGVNVELRRHETGSGTVASVWVPPSGLVAGWEAAPGAAGAQAGAEQPAPARSAPPAPASPRPTPARPEPAVPAAAAAQRPGSVFSRVSSPRPPADDVPRRPSQEIPVAPPASTGPIDRATPAGRDETVDDEVVAPAATEPPARSTGAVPAATEPGPTHRPAPKQPPRPPAPTPPRPDETPLFFEVSAWFQRQVDEEPDAAQPEPAAAAAGPPATSLGAVANGGPHEAAVDQPETRSPDVKRPLPQRSATPSRPLPPRPVRPSAPAAGRPAAGPAPSRPAASARPAAAQPAERAASPLPAREPRPVVRAKGFESAADEGWRAVEAVQSRDQGDLTSAGLPRRTPRANLVPGSAATVRQPAAAPSRPARDADVVRGRLSSYQRGLQSGRSKVRPGRPVTADQARQDADERRQA